MKINKMTFCLFLFIFILEGVYLYDALGQERIISLKPNITEILYELGLQDQIVGVTSYCDRPSGALTKPRVADYVHVDIEKVLAQRPTLIIGSKENSLKKPVDFLLQQGITVKLFSFGRLEDTFRSMIEIGSLFHQEGQAKILVKNLSEQLQQLKISNPKLSKLKVLMVVGMHPLVVVGGNNFLNDLLKTLGLTNLAGESKMSYPNYSVDQLLSSAPDVILDLAMGTETGNGAGYQKEHLEFFEEYASLPAVQKKRIIFLDISDFRAAPSLIVGAKKMVSVFQTMHR